MSAQHTPGPWAVGAGSGAYLAITARHWDAPLVSKVIAGDRSTNECEANAQLIAAAPDMLAALKALFESPDFELGAPKIEGRIGSAKRKMAFSAWNDLVEAAQAAIAKAERRS